MTLPHFVFASCSTFPSVVLTHLHRTRRDAVCGYVNGARGRLMQLQVRGSVCAGGVWVTHSLRGWVSHTGCRSAGQRAPSAAPMISPGLTDVWWGRFHSCTSLLHSLRGCTLGKKNSRLKHKEPVVSEDNKPFSYLLKGLRGCGERRRGFTVAAAVALTHWHTSKGLAVNVLHLQRHHHSGISKTPASINWCQSINKINCLHLIHFRSSWILVWSEVYVETFVHMVNRVCCNVKTPFIKLRHA